MKTYIIKRLLLGLLVLFGVIVLTFFLTRVLPSDPASQWAGLRATPEQKQQAIIKLGLDKPIYEQFIIFFKDLLRGDLGYSLTSKQPVTEELKDYLPATLELIAFSTILSMFIGLPLGVITASKKDKLPDHIGRIFSVGAVSLPVFWVALLLQIVFYRNLNLLPLGGRMSSELKIIYGMPNITGFLLLDSLITGNMELFKDAFLHIILPGITISLYSIGLISRMTRSALLEIFNEDYIKAAKSYGIPKRVILWLYALKNSIGPTATVVAISIGSTLVNTFLVETIFNWSGIGNYISKAVVSMDSPAILGVTIVSAVSYIILNLIADIIVATDPRIRV